ncbi:MAG: hypothetical protein HY562_10910 [Ignavibacteriales bacterium]|nr:hypothetical protein [Ignavibacteriales bacterium]
MAQEVKRAIKMDNSTIAIITALTYVVLTIVQIPVVRYFDHRRLLSAPSQETYRWGYFLGLQGMTWAIMSILVMALSGSDIRIIFQVSVGTIAVWGYPGYTVIQRKKWAWAWLTILSMNPVLWIVNYRYGKNRWSEFH